MNTSPLTTARVDTAGIAALIGCTRGHLTDAGQEPGLVRAFCCAHPRVILKVAQGRTVGCDGVSEVENTL